MRIPVILPDRDGTPFFFFSSSLPFIIIYCYFTGKQWAEKERNRAFPHIAKSLNNKKFLIGIPLFRGKVNFEQDSLICKYSAQSKLSLC